MCWLYLHFILVLCHDTVIQTVFVVITIVVIVVISSDESEVTE